MRNTISPGSEAARRKAARVAPISIKKIVWPVVLSFVVLVVIGVFTFDPREFLDILTELNPWMLFAAAATVIFRTFLGGWRLNYISRGRLGMSGGIRGQLAWDFFSNVTPSAIGGAPFAAVYVARDKQIEIGESTAVVLFSVLLDQLWFSLTIPVVLIAALFMDIIPDSLGDVAAVGFLLYFAAMLVWVVAFGYSTMFRPEILQRFTSRVFRLRLLRRFQERVERGMCDLMTKARVLRSQPLSFYLNGFLLTIGTWACRYLLLLFVVWSFVDDFDKILLVLRTAAMTLGSLVMPTPGGAGGIEGLFALFIGPLVPAAIVMPTLLIWRFLGYYLFVGLGVFLSTHHVQKTIRQRRLSAIPAKIDERIQLVEEEVAT